MAAGLCRRFSLWLAVVLSICLVSVAGFGWSSPASKIIGSVENAIAKKEKEAPSKPRATRTLYKPQEENPEQFELEVLLLEKEIQEATKARLDLQRVNQFLEEDVEATEKLPTSDWQVSMAAGGVAAAATLGVTDNWTLAAISLVTVYVIANGDPLEEQTPAGE